ncbi:hypothetical protein [Lichenibacterium ramalinae]|uniref:Methyl-accepting transducer domain-containing protein n=1 Tax=Lichenibacterium ramalinae TaxID=2316527 RepID=A0A4Q2RAB6_9HYPH|nr:hypothetical protein [Lichenibacterium ramalinae]RYB01808.1 hypothetical protein D3272_24250 [Lichenibacterium ramalinae]
MSDTIRAILPIIAGGTTSIEGAFLSAGQGLSQGLSAFKSLMDSLAALGDDLDRGGTAAASHQLDRLSRMLRAVAEQLPTDGALLRDLLDGNRGMRRKFDDLVGDMRMMVVVSRSARLEAVVSDEQRASLEGFSRTIDDQIGDAQRRIGACAAEHGGVTALLERSAQEHLAFDDAYRDRLTGLAEEFDAALDAMARRREAGLAFTAEAAAKARAITQAAGGALVSLQVGDNTRQRLEHVAHALERSVAQAGASSGGDDDGLAAATADLLCDVAGAQLRDTIAAFDGEASRILDTFALLRREGATLATAGRNAYGSADGGTASFVGEFRTRFAAAMGIVAACAANRLAIEQATGALRSMLAPLDDTLTTLVSTSEDLVIVAMNVGLKAARLGSDGRGLVTVAWELKRLAAEISSHAEALLDAFKALRGISDAFGAPSLEGAASASLDREAEAILDTLALADGRIADVLGMMDRTGGDFDATVAAAIDAFEAVAADTGRLADAADSIEAECSPASHGDAAMAAAAAVVDALLLPTYSMARERDIHAGIVGTGTVAEAGGEPVFEDWAA